MQQPWAIVAQDNKLFNPSSFRNTNANSLAHWLGDSQNYHAFFSIKMIYTFLQSILQNKIIKEFKQDNI